jgi:hypothetical protein
MSADDPPESVKSGIRILLPTKQEMDEGLAEVKRCHPFWKANPAFLVIKPDPGLIVSLQNLVHDDRGFTLTCKVDQTLVAPPDFDENNITLSCGWNQPYVSLNDDRISAPCAFVQ